MSATELLDTDLRLASALMQTRRELEDAHGAIHRQYMADGGTEEARAVGEALLRAVSNLTLSVERMDERLTGEIQRRRVLSGRFDSLERAAS